METKKYIIRTYGCQMNELDSERMSYMLDQLNYEETEKLEDADLIIYNTCIVRENAELKVYGHLGAMKALKEKKTDMIICVCGCMMQIEKARQEIYNKYKHVDIVFGTKNITDLPYLISQHLVSKERIFDIEESDDIDNIQMAIRKNRYSAFVNIIYGCNNFCTYCIVPYTRGRESSRSVESIVKEIKALADDGYKEITLLGQNVNSYGKDLHPCSSFSSLLEEVVKIDGINRIRFMSAHPKDLSDQLIQTIKKYDKICNSVHLPLQSGSNSILKAMNRKYTREAYLDKIKKIKEVIPNASITTDLIIGFPGETEEDFEDTLDMINKVRYDQAFLFKYSKRVGTKAAVMENQVDPEIVSKRFQTALDRINQICYEKNSEYLGRTLEVLIEDYSKNDKSKLTGRTDTNKIVNLTADVKLMGQIVNVKITGFNSFALEGELA